MNFNYTMRVNKSPESLQEETNLFTVNFNSFGEFEPVYNLLNNKRRISWLESLIIPVRTDNFSNFCKDFFLPGLFNNALKTKKVALRIFLCIMMPIYDLITLPIRLITVIPRYIYNAKHPKEAHLFYQYLIQKGVAPADLSAGHVHLEIEQQNQSGLLITQGGCTFNFIHLPRFVSNILTEGTIVGWKNPIVIDDTP